MTSFSKSPLKQAASSSPIAACHSRTASHRRSMAANIEAIRSVTVPTGSLEPKLACVVGTHERRGHVVTYPASPQHPVKCQPAHATLAAIADSGTLTATAVIRVTAAREHTEIAKAR
jgi:hypothetical protein